MDFPDTDDGALLKEMHEAGMDLTTPQKIDFFINFPKKKDAAAMQQEIETGESKTRFLLTENESHDGWVLCCTVQLMPTHEEITQAELAFDKIAAKHQGRSDGWGVLQA